MTELKIENVKQEKKITAHFLIVLTLFTVDVHMMELELEWDMSMGYMYSEGQFANDCQKQNQIHYNGNIFTGDRQKRGEKITTITVATICVFINTDRPIHRALQCISSKLAGYTFFKVAHARLPGNWVCWPIETFNRTTHNLVVNVDSAVWYQFVWLKHNHNQNGMGENNLK